MTVKENILKVMNDMFLDSHFIAFRAKLNHEDTILALRDLLKEKAVMENNGLWRKI